ncbi:MAG: hypothetical protein QXF69_04725 [Thermofilaceae archaeon]
MVAVSSARPVSGSAAPSGQPSPEQQFQESLRRLEQAIAEAQKSIDRAIEDLRRSAQQLEKLAQQMGASKR